MPGDLKVCYFVNSGSEANDLALLMARAYTGNYDMIALRNAYHGGNAAGMGAHRAQHLEIQRAAQLRRAPRASRPIPIAARGAATMPDAGRKYADDVKNLIDYATPGKSPAFIAESIQGVGGCVVFPDGYLKHAYEHVRAAGGVCIADEVQSGFGRTGTHYWGFETQGVIPDIVTHGERHRQRRAARRRRHHAEDRAPRSRSGSTSTPSAATPSSARKARPCSK